MAEIYEPEIKPCPFCGNKSPMLYYSSYTDSYSIHCPQCQSYWRLDCTAGRDRSNAKTIAAWNRRAADDGVQD